VNTPSQFIRVRPVAGGLVRDPATRVPLPAEGADVERSSYWLSRISDGSVELVLPSPPEEPPAPPAVIVPGPAPQKSRPLYYRKEK
jgi:hypothetical protein